MIPAQNAAISAPPKKSGRGCWFYGCTTAFREENLAKGVYEDAEAMARIRRIDSLRVEGDRLVVSPATGN